SATTDTSGNWTMNVTPGTWFIQSYPSGISGSNCSEDVASGGSDSGSGTTSMHSMSKTPTGSRSGSDSAANGAGTGIQYVSLQGTQKAKAIENTTVQIDPFQFVIADATIKGFVRYATGHDQAGSVAPGVNGFLTVSTGNGGVSADMYSNSLYGWISNSQFEIMVPASPDGGYNLQAFLDYFSNYTVVGTGQYTAEGIGALSSSPIEITAGETIDNAVIEVLPNDALIEGTITGFTSTAGFYAQVCADNGDGGYACTFTDSNSYSLPIAAGTWKVNYSIPEGFGVYPKPLTSNTVTVESEGTATVDFELLVADATLEGAVTTPDGEALSGATVLIASDQISTSEETGASGAYSFEIPAGDYTVYITVPEDSSYLNPALQRVTATTNETTAANFVARESDAMISGTITIDGVAAEDVLVAAYAEDGAQADTTTDESGAYTLSVFSGADWSVRALYDDTENDRSLDSGVTTVTVDSATETLDIDIQTTDAQSITAQSGGRKIAAITNSLPAEQRKSFSASTQQVFTFSDGARFNAPAYSFKSSEDTLDVAITPTSEVPSVSTHQVISYGYAAEARDSNNAKIGTFASALAITLPYTEAQLSEFGITEDDITMGMYDGNTWRDVTGAVVNEETNTITANMTRFGTFAVTTSVRSMTSSVETPANLHVLKKLRANRFFTVKWDAVEGADSYVLQVWKGDTLVKSSTVSKTRKKIVKLTSNTPYKVRVAAVTNNVQSEWSDYLTVRTKPSAPQKLVIIKKQVRKNGQGSFRVRFVQPKVRKGLQTVVKVYTNDNQSIPFKFAGKKKTKKVYAFKVKAKSKTQRQTVLVGSEYVGMQLRVKIFVRQIKKPKVNKSSVVQSGLFTIE
ncbi:MAG TPA: carboxypeptidase regulatory-like domain-containing protein, partial [Patescibacteria group bacterium]|nr:carboxypeptidase regulatory-like domain-containing protein [Patescibacteria group bacterium]